MRRENALNEPDDSTIDIAVSNLIRVLTDKGIYAREINISLNNPIYHQTEDTFRITLETLTDPTDIHPDFPGQSAIYALLDVDEEGDLHD